jgi:hypothetical protein
MLAQLCYARGSILPCSLKIECDDRSYLDLFAAPTAIAVHLERQVKFFSKPTYARQDVAWNESVADMGAAVWWPSPSYRHDPSARYLEGEIKLGKDLRPTSALGHFSISVSNLVGFGISPQLTWNISTPWCFAPFKSHTSVRMLRVYCLSPWRLPPCMGKDLVHMRTLLPLMIR